MFNRALKEANKYLEQRVLALATQLDERVGLASMRLNEMRGELEKVKLERYQARQALARYALDDIKRFGT